MWKMDMNIAFPGLSHLFGDWIEVKRSIDEECTGELKRLDGDISYSHVPCSAPAMKKKILVSNFSTDLHSKMQPWNPRNLE